MRTALKPIPDGAKATQVTEILARMARELGSGAKLPTKRELYKKLGISQSTLDAALDRLELQGLLYRKHGSGIYVSTLAQTRRIGLVIPQDLIGGAADGGNFYKLLLASIRTECRVRDILLTTYTLDCAKDRARFGPEPLEMDVENGRVDALITCAVTTEQARAVRTLGVPCADYTDNEEFFPRISLDWRMLVKDGVDALVSKGCRRIGFVHASSPGWTSPTAGLEQFRQCVRQVGIAEGFEWLMPFDVNALSQRPLEASRLFHSMWANSTQRPDGLLSTNDEFTSGVLHAMEVLGVRCPEDLLVASHANKGLDLFGAHKVIRLEYDPEERAKVILDTVDGLLAGRPVPREQIVPHRMVWPEEMVNRMRE